MKLTANLSRHEFACKCGCGFDTADFELVNVLQQIVDHFDDKYNTDFSIHITSGARCKQHNTFVGGGQKSQHLYGRAADFYLRDRTSNAILNHKEVAEYIDIIRPNSFGLGLYDSWVHVDSRRIPARWDNRA